ncbi:MAG: hypothetical protein JWO68_2 [Actinomycetia bacterium]|nr:hypothetical protein [Actinomycetes bacterium]
MNERKHVDQVLEAAPDVAPEATQENGGHPLLNLQRKAGNAAVNRMVQTKLTVGEAGDAYEQEADRVAADVMRRLQGGDTGDDVQRTSAVPAVQAKSADPLGGTDVSPEVASTISASSGRPMDGGTQTRMEGAFGADFSSVRIHDNAEAGAASESLQAHAFTTGSDVFFRKGGYDPGSSGGQELLAHELTHVVQQQGGTASRQIRRFIDVKTFAERTSEGRFTRKSTAQIAIEKKLATYAKLGAKNDKGKIVIPDTKLAQAVSLITDMKEAANLWIGAHTVEETEDDGTVTTTVDPSRQNRAAGMAWFFMAADGELAALENRINTAASAVEQDEVVADPSGALKLKEHYQGNLSGSLKAIGTLIDKVAPNDGDSTELSVDLKIPIQPGVFIGGTLDLGVEKDGNTEVSCEAAFQAGGSAGVADIAGALGGYVKAGGPNGAGVMKLVSYGFYRRIKESEVIPGEIASLIWGGGTSEFAKKKANQWSLAIEEELLGTAAEGEEENENYVELGGLASVGVEVDLGVAELEAGAKYSSGKRYDPKSMEARKGGAGEANSKSGSFFTQNVSQKFGRGAEKSTGRSTHNLELSFAAAVLDGALSGELGFEASWRDQGRHAEERATTTDNVQLEDMEFSFSVTGSVPTDGIAAKLLKIAEEASDEAKKSAVKAAAKAGEEEDAPTAELNAAKAEAAAAFNSVRSLPFGEWYAAISPAPEEGAEEGAEAAVETGSSVGLELAFGIEKAGTGWKGTVELKHVKSSSLELPELLEIELVRKKRLGKATYAGGAWS